MNRWTRALLALVLSLVFVFSPLASLAEGMPEGEPAAVETEKPVETAPPETQPPKADTPEPEPTEPEKTATATPDDPATEAPIRARELKFRHAQVEITLKQYAAGLDFGKLNALKALPEGAQKEALIFSVRDKKDGKLDDSVAAFVDYDKNGEKLEGNYAESEIEETRFEVYAAGDAYVRAALKSDPSIYAEFKLIVIDTSADEGAADAPANDDAADDGADDLPVEDDLIESTPPEDGADDNAADDNAAGDDLPVEGDLIESVLPEDGADDDVEGDVPGDLQEENLIESDLPGGDADVGDPDETETPDETEIPEDIDGMPQDMMTMDLLDTLPLDGGEDASVPFTLSAISKALNVGEEATITASVDPEVIAPILDWQIDEPGEAAVSMDVASDTLSATFVATAVGTANITVSIVDNEGETKSASVTITVDLYPTDLFPAEGTSDTYILKAEEEQPLAVSSTNVENPSVGWTTSDAAVATVAADGTVTAVGTGVATITATAENGKTCDFEIVVATLSLSTAGDVTYVPDGKALQIDAQIAPRALPLTWSSADEEIATVDANGLVTGQAVGGPVTITAKIADSTIEATIDITVVTPVDSVAIGGPGVSIDPEHGDRSLRLYSGAGAELVAEVLPEDAFDKSVEWISSDDTVASVDPATGAVNALKYGDVTITARSKSDSAIEGTLSLSVRDRAEFINVTPTNSVVDLYDEEKTVQLTARVYPATAGEVHWSSSNTAVATVDQNGLVTCLGNGYAVIYARAADPEVDPDAPVAISLIKVVQHVTGIGLHTDPFTAVYQPPFDLYIAVNQIVPIGVTLKPAGAANTGYVIESGNTARVAVNGDKIKGLRTGDTTITIRANETGAGTIERTLKVRVVAKGKGVTGFKLNKTSVAITVGTSFTLKGTSTPSKSSYKGVRWYSADESVATVHPTNGKVFGVTANESTTIYAISTSGIIRSCRVDIKPQMPTSVKIASPWTNTSSATLGVGEMLQLNPLVYPSTVEEENRGVEWRSSKPTVALVSDDGMVYAIASGTTTIYTRTANNKVGSFKVTVKNHAIANDRIRLYDNNGPMYAGGFYYLDYELFLNGATTSSMTLADIANSYGMDGFEDFDFVYYNSPSKYGLPLDPTILASNMTNMGVIWNTSNSKIAKVDTYTGVIQALKPGAVEIWAKSRANTGSKAFARIKLTFGVPSAGDALRVFDGSTEIYDGSAVNLIYGDATSGKKALSAQYPSNLVLDWYTDDDSIATVDKNGTITAKGLGSTTVWAILAGGIDGRQITVNVTRADGTSDVTYRALVVGMYQTSGQAGYLPFGSNSTSLVRSAIRSSNIDGDRYSVTFRNNSQIKNLANLQSAVNTAFSGAKDGDVSIVFLHTHGTVDKNGEYRWHLSGTGSKAAYLTGNQVLSTLSGVKGHVLLNVASCYSGNSSTSSSIISRAKAQDAARSAYPGRSLSIITSTDGLHQSGFLNTANTISVDFFSAGFYVALDSASGQLTVADMFSRIKDGTAAAVAAYKLKYGTYSLAGTNNVQMAISPNARDIVVYGG